MAQSYLGSDRFGALDRSFETGVQLGTQIVRERQQREQKLQDEARQQQAERAAEDHRAQLQIQSHAAELAQNEAARVQSIKDNLNDPVQNRKNILTDDIADVTKQLDAQDARSTLVLNPNDAGYSDGARQFARTAIANNAKIRANLNQAANQPIDASKPILLPSQDPTMRPDPNNDVSTLDQTQMYTPAYIDSLTKDKNGAMTAYQQAEIGIRTQHEKYIESQNKGGARNFATAQRAFSSGVDALNEYGSYSGAQPNDANGEPDATWLQRKNKASDKANLGTFGITGALLNPQFIGNYVNDPGDVPFVQSYLSEQLGKFGTTPTPDDLLKLRSQILSDANAYNPKGSAYARGVSKAARVAATMFAMPPVAEPSSGSSAGDDSGEDAQ